MPGAVGYPVVHRALGGTSRPLRLLDEIAARNARMRENPDAFVAGYDWIWGYDASSAAPGG